MYFVEAASMTVEDEKKKQNYRDDVNFADYVRTVCDAWYNASDADFSFRCTRRCALSSLGYPAHARRGCSKCPRVITSMPWRVQSLAMLTPSLRSSAAFRTPAR